MNDDTTAIALAESTQDKVAELTAPLKDAAAKVSRKAGENIGLTLIGGLAVGLALGALLPVARSRKPAKKTVRTLAASLAGAVSELSQTLAAQARDRAEATAEDARETLNQASHSIGKSLHDHSESLGKHAKKLADSAADQLNDGGKAIARQVVKLVEKARS